MNGCGIFLLYLLFVLIVLAIGIAFYGTLAYVLLWVLSHFIHINGFHR